MSPAELCAEWRRKASVLRSDRRYNPHVTDAAADTYEECAESLARALGGTPRPMVPTRPPTTRGVAPEET